MNVTIGTPFKSSAVKVLLCGSGELGKEVSIEAAREKPVMSTQP